MEFVNKFVVLITFAIFSYNSLFGIETDESKLTTNQLIEKAHEHDNMWASDENADQKKALEYYNAALESEPDDEQRLHILYRMAQLYGSAYQLEKGEKPDFHKAIELNGEIVKSYPQTEPLVFKALISLGDHHVTLREFDKGLEYFKQALEYNISDLIQLRDNAEDEEEIRLLEGNISRIKQFQKIAVDQVGYCATFVDPVCAHGAFRNIAETHSQSFIREYAAEKMSSSMDEFSDLWAPTLSMGDKSFIVKTQRSIPVKKTVAPPKQIQVDSSSEQKSPILSSASLEAHARASPSKTKLLFYLFTGILIVLILGFSGMVMKKKKKHYQWKECIMKKKFLTIFTAAFVFAILTTAFAITYEAHTPITDVSITGTLSDGDSVAINTEYTMTCSESTDTDKYCDQEGWHYPDDPVTHTWSGSGTFDPTTGTEVTWTSPSSTGNKTITVTASDSPLYDETTHPSDSISVTVVKVDWIQYDDPDNGWTNIQDSPSFALYVRKGTTVNFKAIPDPGEATWPSGKPVWGGTSGASGTGATTSVTFNTLSTSLTDYKTVTAECGNTYTAYIIVYEMEGTFTPDDDFSGRSTEYYGIEETVELSFDTDPWSVTAGQAGGLEWTIGSGVGALSNTGDDGMADYDAQESDGGVIFVLTIKSGPSKGSWVGYSKEVVKPTGTRMTRYSGNVKHTYNYASAGIGLYYWLDPKNVSFSNLTFGEYSCPSTSVSGFYLSCDPWNSYPTGSQVPGHTQNTFGAILGGDSTNGCRVSAMDGAFSGAANPYAAGSFTWSIPTQYIDDTATRNSFGSNQNHVSTYQASGYATQAKGGQSGSAALNAASSGY